MAADAGAGEAIGLIQRIAQRYDLAPRSAMLASRYRPVRRIALSAFAFLMLRSVRRRRWVTGRGRIPSTRLEFRAPEPITPSQIALCERLLASYKKVCEEWPDESGADGMWSWIVSSRQSHLAATLDSGDAESLARLMSGMLAEDFVLGMGPGRLLRESGRYFGAWAWGLKCLDGLASLGEVLGIVAVESPEQGNVGLAFDDGLERLVSGLEDELGFSIDFPHVGAASGLSVGTRLIAPDTPDQIYAALRLEQAIQLHAARRNGSSEPMSIVEIGGGYGAMAYWLARRELHTTSYTIIDLPIVGVLQGYFLGQALGPDCVSLYGESPAAIRIVPNVALGVVECPFDIMVNKDSLPEMPPDVMHGYLSWGAANCRSLFYSYNQETASEFLGEPQGIVHRVVESSGGFTRVRRDRAWVREGYVEEVYVPAGATVSS